MMQQVKSSPSLFAIFNVDTETSFLKSEMLQKDACTMVSLAFDNSEIKTRLVKLESEIRNSDSVIEGILQF